MREIFVREGAEPVTGNTFDWIDYRKNCNFKQKIKMGNLTQWEHFKKNGLWPMIFCFTLFVASLVLSIIRDDIWQLSFFFLGLCLVLVIGNHFSWKKKFGPKK